MNTYTMFRYIINKYLSQKRQFCPTKRGESHLNSFSINLHIYCFSYF